MKTGYGYKKHFFNPCMPVHSNDRQTNRKQPLALDSPTISVMAPTTSIYNADRDADALLVAGLRKRGVASVCVVVFLFKHFCNV